MHTFAPEMFFHLGIFLQIIIVLTDMIILKISASVLSVLFIMDFYHCFVGANAGSMTTGLCRPFWGIFYRKLSMFSGFLLWILEGILSFCGIICWLF
jgi:hypothetical protein